MPSEPTAIPSPQSPEPIIGPKEKVTILLAEYNTLRAELLQRNTIFNQFLIVSIPATITIVGLIVANTAYLAAAVAAGGLALFMAVMAKILMFDTVRAAKHLRGLEARINSIAGDQLLRWETESGLYKVGTFSRLIGKG